MPYNDFSMMRLSLATVVMSGLECKKNFTGTIPHVLSDSKGIKSLSFYERSLETDIAVFTLQNEGKTTLRPSVDRWTAKNSDARTNELTNQSKGQPAKIITFK